MIIFGGKEITMKSRLILLITCIQMICIFTPGYANTQDFQVREIFDKIFALKNTEDGNEQVVIVSEKGLVVLNSFWSETTAQRFKAGIIEALKRDDFLYLINMVDRLDLFGGNAAYRDIPIIGHKALLDKYKGKEAEIRAEIDDLVEMWRWKENVARERMPEHEPGSEQAITEQKWINTCKNRANELEEGFSLVLPTETYEDRKTLNLGDLTLNLVWFGKAGYDGETVIIIPELNLAMIPGFIMHPHHLAPYPQAEFSELDVPRWIRILEEILEGESAVENVLCGANYTDLWSRDRARTHLRYIRELWNAVTKAEAEGKDLPEIHEQLSLENEFAFVKEMHSYIEDGDDWVRPQHHTHIRLFFLQHKNLASELIKESGYDSLSVALAKIRKLRNEGEDIYVEEAAINGIGYHLLNMERFADAIEVFRLNVDVFPESWNVYDSYAEALMKSGDIENAVINYNKSLQLNPENGNAREILETLEKQ
jgi:tetratricopeptide (TPR) repeat protein